MDSKETEATIWLGLHRTAIHLRVGQFLYKTMHGTQKIGPYWEHIPGYQDCQTCTSCSRIETMEHILVACEESLTRANLANGERVLARTDL